VTIAADLLELELEPRVDGQGRRIFAGVEHGEIDVPAHLLVRGDAIDLYESVSKRSFFRIYGKNGRLVLHAGNAIGLIPLNDRVSLEVNSRVPIRNLERLLCFMEDYDPHILTFDRTYQEAVDLPDSILDIMADALLRAVEALRDEGLYKSYRQITEQGTPSGRVLPFQSAVAQMRRGSPTAVSTRFDRSLHNDVNRHIKAALTTLLETYSNLRERRGVRLRVSRLSRALGLFGEVPSSEAIPHFNSALVRDPDQLPVTRPSLSQAVRVSSLILRSAGLRIRELSGTFAAPSILIEMETVFERYVRQFLRSLLTDVLGLQILDGNLDPPAGGAGAVFDKALSKHGNSRATPDTMFVFGGKTAVIIETKYKPCKGMPERDELNQAITYGCAFRCPRVILTYPAYDDKIAIELLGEVAGVEIYKATTSLGAVDLPAAELRFAELLRPMLEA
jgi:5-methylcytosine-specific restriction enzyme subunit McrC